MGYSDNTETLRGLISLASGRNSDIRPAALAGDDTETTFVFTVPQRDTQDDEHSDGAPGSPVEDEDVEHLDFDEVDEIDVEGAWEEQGNPRVGDVDNGVEDTTMLGIDTADIEKSKTRKKKFKISKHGIQYPSLPAGVVKKLATTFARTGGNSKAKISKDTLDAIMQASDWFFEQVSDDLGAYAKHAGRKTIDESDVVTLMGRYDSSPNNKPSHTLILTCG
jgi:histone H3/H4